MQTVLTQGAVTRVPTVVPANLREPKIDRAALTAFTSGQPAPKKASKATERAAALVTEYGPERIEGTYGSKTYVEPATPVTHAPVKVRLNAPFRPDQVVTLLVETNPKKRGNKNWPWFQAIMDSIATGDSTVAGVIKAGSHMGELKYDVEHKYISIK